MIRRVLRQKVTRWRRGPATRGKPTPRRRAPTRLRYDHWGSKLGHSGGSLGDRFRKLPTPTPRARVSVGATVTLALRGHAGCRCDQVAGDWRHCARTRAISAHSPRRLVSMHNINQFLKSRRDSAGDLLGITEHRLIDHKGLMLDHFLAVGTLVGCQLSRSLLGAPSAQVDRRQPASRRQR